VIETHNRVVLVLGGSGLLGAHCYELLKNEYKVILTYNSVKLANHDCVYFNVLDGISSLDRLLVTFKPDIIINTIALVSVEGCAADSDLARRLNADFVADLVRSMRKNGLTGTHLIQISSDSVYGNFSDERSRRPWRESDAINPLSDYAKTKYLGELEALQHQGYVSILRTAFYGINADFSKGLLWWIIDNAKNGRDIDGWENIYFNPISANDLVMVIKKMISQTTVGIYNIGTYDYCTKYDFVDSVCSILGLGAKVNRVCFGKGEISCLRPTYSVINVDKLYKEILWKKTWNDSLLLYLANINVSSK
jgi:dTDP-4-dehydrorhamnose reductase